MGGCYHGRHLKKYWLLCLCGLLPFILKSQIKSLLGFFLFVAQVTHPSLSINTATSRTFLSNSFIASISSVDKSKSKICSDTDSITSWQSRRKACVKMTKTTTIQPLFFQKKRRKLTLMFSWMREGVMLFGITTMFLCSSHFKITWKIRINLQLLTVLCGYTHNWKAECRRMDIPPSIRLKISTRRQLQSSCHVRVREGVGVRGGVLGQGGPAWPQRLAWKSWEYVWGGSNI